MRHTIRAVLLPLAIVVIAGFTIIVVNQTVQLVDLASRVHPYLGTTVLLGIVTLFVVGIGYPVYALLRLPKPLIPPASTSGPEYERFRTALEARLRTNPNLLHLPSGTLDMSVALGELDKIAEERTKSFAKKVFLGTAISQNGSVDTLLVLAAQGRLVYEIACVYNQRPSLRELGYLYANVAATAFVAGEVEDIEVAEHVQPILSAVLGSSIAAVPGLNAAAGLFIHSVVTGAGNAFLTLRVGLLASEYSRPSHDGDRRKVRRSAAVRALPLLGKIVAEGAAAVAASIWDKPKKVFLDAIDSALTVLKKPWWKRTPKAEPPAPQPAQ